MKVFVALQARSSSKRLPDKIYKSIGPKSVLKWAYDAAYEATQLLKNELQIPAYVKVVGTKDDLKLKEFCKEQKMSCELVNVNENDLFARFNSVFKSDYTHLVRLTADCWRLDSFLIASCIDLMKKQELDYVSNTIFRTFEEGKDIQACSLKGFSWFFKNQKENREHPFVEFDLNKKVRDQFEKDGLKYGIFTNPRFHYLVRGTSIDTQEDLDLANEIYDKEYKSAK